jgi:glycosyltransferase involved in cell wall biosynthesis
MRIAQITATFPPYHGGTGLVCYHNAIELARRGHEVHVFTARTRQASQDEIIQGVRLHRLQPLLHTGNAPLMPQLVSRLRGFDILHLHYPFYGGELSALAARLWRTLLVITYHQDVHLQGVTGVIERLLRPTTSRATLRSAERVLFTTLDYSQASYARKLLKGREAHIGELSNGVDTSFFTPGAAPPVLHQKYALEAGERVVLLVAALDSAHYFKGVEVLLEALTRLPANVKAVIVGDGDLRTAYEQKADRLGLADRVRFAGRVPETDLPDMYRLADVTVLPSLTMGEAFGLVLIESMACGTPAIASSLPGVRTVVSEGVDGYLTKPGDGCDLADKLQQVFALPIAQRLAMGAAGRRKVTQKYTWKLAGERLEAIYQQVLA